VFNYPHGLFQNTQNSNLKARLSMSGAVAEGAVGLWGGVKGWASDRLRSSRDEGDSSSDEEDGHLDGGDKQGVNCVVWPLQRPG